MHKLAPLALAILTLPGASAIDPLASAPDTIGRALDGGLVSITASLDPTVQPGDVLPFCDDAAPPNGTLLIGTLTGCFQPVPEQSFGAPAGDCSPVGGTILGAEFPYVAPKFDQECLERRLDDLAGAVPNAPVIIGLDLKT